MKARENPFATGRVERLLRFDPTLVGTSWEEIEARWEALGRRACVVGHHGAGKTTFLDAFAARHPRVVRLFFNQQHRHLDAAARHRLAMAAGALLVVDGDAHLPGHERRELLRAADSCSGLLLARHRPGRLPVLLRLQATEALARELAGRLGVAGLPDLPTRLRRARHNLRELWLDCYDRAEDDGLEVKTF